MSNQIDSLIEENAEYAKQNQHLRGLISVILTQVLYEDINMRVNSEAVVNDLGLSSLEDATKTLQDALTYNREPLKESDEVFYTFNGAVRELFTGFDGSGLGYEVSDEKFEETSNFILSRMSEELSAESLLDTLMSALSDDADNEERQVH